MIERAKNRGCALVAGMLLLVPGAAHAQLGTWATDPAVGASDLDVTIQISCAAPSFVCSLVDGYADTQTSSLSGSGGLLVDAPLGTLRFETDGLQDWGTGPQPVYNLFSGGSMIFASVPFAGVPQIASLLVFASSDPLIPVPGFFDLGPGDYPFSQSVPYGLLADIVGDMELNVPDIVSPPQSILLTGTLRILGDIDLDGMVEYELTQFSAVQSLQQPGNIGGEPVTIAITSALSANLSGEVAGPVALPALGSLASLLLAAGLGLIGGGAARRPGSAHWTRAPDPCS
jgi:hypothetical protein